MKIVTLRNSFRYMKKILIAAIENPLVNIISHPGDGTADLLFEPVVLAANYDLSLLPFL